MLADGQTVNMGTQTAVVDDTRDDDTVPFSPFSTKTTPEINQECQKVPMMNRTFFARRSWNSFLNLIIFFDREGNEIGYVQSWLMDWRNPFGFPGASLYLKAHVEAAHKGEFGEPTENAYGWTSSNEAPLQLNVTQQAILEAHAEHLRDSGTNAYDVETHEAGRLSLGRFSHRPVAYITGKEDPSGEFLDQLKYFFGGAFIDQVQIKDCKDELLFKTKDNKVSIAGDKVQADSQFETSQTEAANKIVISDFTAPVPVELATMEQKAPCSPFPPFCAQMGLLNWVFHKDEWEGQITEPGYAETINSGSVNVELTSGAATDMRFLLLYSSFLFSNTRWSPVMWYVAWGSLIFLIMALCGCCKCCPCPFWPFRGHMKQDFYILDPESEHLMKTVESESPQESPKSGMFNCCSRKGGGRQIGVTIPGEKGHH